MKRTAYLSFDAYAADQTAFHRRLIAPLRRFVAATAPGLVEAVKWGNGCWLAGKAPVAYVYADVDHLQFGFFRGASLRDPLGLLHGNGQYVRHIKLRRPADLDRAPNAAALAATRRRMAHGPRAERPRDPPRRQETSANFSSLPTADRRP
jgi:hypothetical protein